MIIKKANTKSELSEFYKITHEIYKNYKFYRATENDLVKFIVEGISHFHLHSEVIPFIILKNKKVIGRFALIEDLKLDDYLQISFLEFLPDADLSLVDKIIDVIKNYTTSKKKVVFGINGHLNYGAGFLKNRFDEFPVYGLPYTPDYYPKYFSKLEEIELISFRLPIEDAENFSKKIPENLINNNITVRIADFKYFNLEIENYTSLNNKCFANHPFWSERKEQEDYELIEHIKTLITPENLLIAEYHDQIVGFLLWFPDYNQLITNNKSSLKCKSNFSPHVLKYKYFNKIDALRLAEIAVIPEFHKKNVDIALILKLIEVTRGCNYKFCEGGFIFNNNFSSLNLVMRYAQRFLNKKIDVYRKFAIYEISF